MMEPVKIELYDVNNVKIDESLVGPGGVLLKPLSAPPTGGLFVTLFGSMTPAYPNHHISVASALPS